jgi:hypothetical protein
MQPKPYIVGEIGAWSKHAWTKAIGEDHRQAYACRADAHASVYGVRINR